MTKTQEGSKLAIWEALSKTDPKHTKPFKRAGGFSGTAIKPIWAVKRLTEEFGPIGKGWGHGRPIFEVVPGDNREVLVYCTVECWHGHPDNSFYGVGGDRVVRYIPANARFNRPERWENDDEAFKKAFTDAVGNAFKFLGVGADIHMGQFEDSKYLAQLNEEFAGNGARDNAEDSTSSPRPYAFPEGPAKGITELKNMTRQLWREVDGCGDDGELRALLDAKESKAILAQLAGLEDPNHRQIWEGDGKDNPGLSGLITRKQTEFAQHIADIARV